MPGARCTRSLVCAWVVKMHTTQPHARNGSWLLDYLVGAGERRGGHTVDVARSLPEKFGDADAALTGISPPSLQIKPQPLLGSHPFGPRLIDIGSDELVQRIDHLLVLVGTTLGSFAG